MKHKYLIKTAAMSEETRLQRIETLTKKKEKAEIQLQKAINDVNNLDATLFKKIIKPIMMGTGLSEDKVKEIMAKYHSQRYREISDDEEIITAVWNNFNLAQYFHFSLSDVFSNKFSQCISIEDENMKPYLEFSKDYLSNNNYKYILNCTTYSLRSLFWMVINDCPALKKCDKVFNVLNELYYKFDKYDIDALKYVVRKKHSALAEIEEKLDYLNSFIGEDEIRQQRIKQYFYATPQVQDQVLDLILELVNQLYTHNKEIYADKLVDAKAELLGLHEPARKELQNYFETHLDEANIKNKFDRIDKQVVDFKINDTAGYDFRKELFVEVFGDVNSFWAYVPQSTNLYRFKLCKKRVNDIQNQINQLEQTLGTDELRKKYAYNLLLDLFQRVYETIGQILELEYIEINNKGGIDGIMIGEKGKAKVNTVGAGGYNIQQFHFRTLVNKI